LLCGGDENVTSHVRDDIQRRMELTKLKSKLAVSDLERISDAKKRMLVVEQNSQLDPFSGSAEAPMLENVEALQLPSGAEIDDDTTRVLHVMASASTSESDQPSDSFKSFVDEYVKALADFGQDLLSHLETLGKKLNSTENPCGAGEPLICAYTCHNETCKCSPSLQTFDKHCCACARDKSLKDNSTDDSTKDKNRHLYPGRGGYGGGFGRGGYGGFGRGYGGYGGFGRGYGGFGRGFGYGGYGGYGGFGRGFGYGFGRPWGWGYGFGRPWWGYGGYW